jgi:hypothetical protein
MNIVPAGIDLGKHVFALHGVDATCSPVSLTQRQQLPRQIGEQRKARCGAEQGSGDAGDDFWFEFAQPLPSARACEE